MTTGPRNAQVYICRIRLHNFRGIDEFEITLEPKLTLLVGRNNVGKSRVLRAIALATGGETPSTDDLSHGLDTESEQCFIDVELAPVDEDSHRVGEFPVEESKVLAQAQNMGTDDEPEERFAWRTILVPSKEGHGPRATRSPLVKVRGASGWTEPTVHQSLSRESHNLIESVLIHPGRDLDKELRTRGTPANRLLKDLDIPDEEKHTLEARAAKLSSEIMSASSRLADMQQTLHSIATQSDTVGTPSIAALPQSLDEVGSSVEISLATTNDSLPLRFHGSGARSLSSLMIHGAMYRQLLGADGTDLRPHPVSLVEEPEAHLHPAAQADLAHQLSTLPGQVIATTHSSHTVTYAPPESIRLLRRAQGILRVKDLMFEAESSYIPDEKRWLQDELEKMLRLVERPFGELLFADAVVIPDGATERALLPPILKYVLGPRSAGILVVDPMSMSNAKPLAKFLRRTSTPCLLFADSDEKGRLDAKSIVDMGTDEYCFSSVSYPDGQATD